MPPAFILSHDQTLKFMSPSRRSGIPRHDSSSQGAALHKILQTTRAVRKPHRPSITYGYVKDIWERLSFKRLSRALRTPETASRRPHVPSSKPTMSNSRQKYRHSHNLPRGRLGASGCLRPQQPDRVAVRCGDTPLGPIPNPVKRKFHFYGNFRELARSARP